jgi:hypothetical protein
MESFTPRTLATGSDKMYNKAFLVLTLAMVGAGVSPDFFAGEAGSDRREPEEPKSPSGAREEERRRKQEERKKNKKELE